MPQSRIQDHFSPSQKYPPKASTQRGTQSRRPPPRSDDHDSEGSEGMGRIGLSAKKGKVSRRKCVPDLQMSQKRGSRKVADSDDDESEEEGRGKKGRNGRTQSRNSDSPVPRSTQRRRADTDPDDEVSEADSLVDAMAKSRGKKQRSPSCSPTPTPSSSRPKRDLPSSSRNRTPIYKHRTRPEVFIPLSSPSQKGKKPSTPITKSTKTKRSGVIEVLDSSSSDDDHTPITCRRRVPSKPKSSPIAYKRPREQTPENSRSVTRTPGSGKRVRSYDPDEDEEPSSPEEDLVGELELDEQERFKSKTRLRPVVLSEFQKNLQRMKNKRAGKEDTESEEEEEEGSENDEEQEEEADKMDVDENDDSFFVDDGGEVPDGLLPHEFSNRAVQTPEYKFKVVFHYLLYLVMKGENLLPLRGENKKYFEADLIDVRRRMQGFKNHSVRSQIWSTNFVRQLEKYPTFTSAEMDEPEWWCHACRRRMPSRLQIWLGGKPYNADTHETLSDYVSSESEEESDTNMLKKDARHRKQFLMGNHCCRRARSYHALVHWEDDMYDRISAIYDDLLRAAGMDVPDESGTSSEDDSDEDQIDRITRRYARTNRRAKNRARANNLEKRKLPKDVLDVDQVLTWMDENSVVTKLWHVMEEMITEAQDLEWDSSTDR